MDTRQGGRAVAIGHPEPPAGRPRLGRIMAGGAGLFVLGRSGSLVAAFVPRRPAFAILAGFGALSGCSLMVYTVNQLSIRQAVRPDRLLGRVQSGVFVLVAAAQVTGSLLGGAIGQLAGMRTAIVVGAVMTLSSALPSVLSPLRSLRGVPALVA